MRGDPRSSGKLGCLAGSGGRPLFTLGTKPGAPFWQFLQQTDLTAGRGAEAGQLVVGRGQAQSTRVGRGRLRPGRKHVRVERT